MQRSIVGKGLLPLLLTAACACSGGTNGQDAKKPYDAGSRSQVFIDKALVASTEGVAFTLRPARKHPTALWLSGPERERGPVGTVVIRDEQEGVFKSWSSSAYNTSEDGLRWTEGQKNDETWLHIIRAFIMKDTADPDPARRYKLLTFGPPAPFPADIQHATKVTLPDGTETIFWNCLGYNTLVSPDGRALTHLSGKSILVNEQGRAPGDMLCAYYDQRLKRYVAFLKTHSKASKFTQRRIFAITTSEDFNAWDSARLAFVPDQADDDGAMARIEKVRPLLPNPTEPARIRTDVYGVGGPIQLESGVIAILRLYTIHNKIDGGFSEVQMAFSRDLENWDRSFREPFIPRGKVGDTPEASDWDTCWFNAEGPAVAMGDEIWIYYSARNTPHNHPVGFAKGNFSAQERAEAQKLVGTKYKSGMGIAVWQRDRFVGVDTSQAGGRLTTVPLVFKGERLEVNASTKAGGEIVVELLKADGLVLGRSKPIRGDSLRHVVEWERPVRIADLAGTPVALRFLMKHSELYAFAFRE